MRHTLIVLVSSALFLLPQAAFAAAQVGKPAPEFSTTAIDGATVKPSFYKNLGQIVVLEWNNPDCPFVHKHYDSENMQNLQSFAERNNVVWLTINSSGPGKEGHIDTVQAKDYINANHLGASHYILDSDGSIGKLYGAKTTPHMFIIDKKGNIAYMGAIDDNSSADPATVKGAKNYVQDALANLLAGKPVAVSSTQSYGCSVKYSN